MSTPGWGSATGNLKIYEATNDLTLNIVLDRIAITDRIYRYAWAFDERRIDALGNCFTNDAVWEGNTQGLMPVPPINGRKLITDWLSGFWLHQKDQRRHHMFSIVIDNQGATEADAMVSLSLISASELKIKIVLTSFYKLHLLKEGNTWRISYLFEGFDVAF
jgi:hypothetical protein